MVRHPMQITSAQFNSIARVLGSDAFTIHDAARIIALARLAVEADEREDIDESDLLETLTGYVTMLAGSPGAPLADADDGRGDLPDRLARLTAGLEGRAAELAYIVSYLLTISDLNIDPEEEAFTDQLRVALSISEDRADELVALINTAITPSE
jgi:hypothetical protein